MSEPQSLYDQLVYGLSLPERVVRGLSAGVGGLVNESAARLIPAAFRSSRSYNNFIESSLRILIHDVGGVARDEAESDAVPESEEDVSLARKAVGGMLDFAGSATMPVSPLTVLAVINDVAYGSNVFLKQLAAELEREGIIDDSSTIHHVSDLIDVVGKTSKGAMSAAEAPPLDAAALTDTVTRLRAELSEADPASIIPQAELERVWNDMRSIADSSRLGFWQVGAAVALHSMDRMDTVVRGSLSSVRVAGSLLDQHIVSHYADAVSDIYRRGLYETVAEASQPYTDAIWENFSPARETWTSELLAGRLLKKLF